METKSLGFIGGGRITRIILQALTNKGAKVSNIYVYDKDPGVLSQLKDMFPQITMVDTASKAASQHFVLIALHPPVIKETLECIAMDINSEAVIISLAPKINIAKISKLLRKDYPIARLIPNATSYINEGYNPICFSEKFPESQKQTLMSLLGLLGHTFEVCEDKLEGYAILSAMLPTYFWFQWKSLQEIGLKIGLDEKETIDSIQKTTISAMKLLFDTGMTHEQVTDLIPVKPIGEHEQMIAEYFSKKLLPLYEKIKP